MIDLSKALPYLNLVFKASLDFDLEPSLILAIIYAESNCELMSYRYEMRSKYFVNPGLYAKKLKISPETEVNAQQCSYGLMHVMGFKAREMGYTGHLPEMLRSAELSIKMGCMALSNFQKHYPMGDDAIASYNAGSPRLSMGKYVNQIYVDKIKMYQQYISVNVKF